MAAVIEDEIVAIVDETNRVVGEAPRARMRAEGLVHRATYILVFNDRGEIFVQKRTPTKDIYPGSYDVATGGVVLAGESYETAAERELAEELGITGVHLTAHFDFFYQNDGNRVWGRAFSCTYSGAVVLQAEEVASGGFCPVVEILENRPQRSFTPDGLYVLKRFLSQSPPPSGGGR